MSSDLSPQEVFKTRSARAPQLDETQARQRARARVRESEAQVSESRAELSPKARNQASDADKGSWLKELESDDEARANAR